jgi:hypothetical protein
VNYDRLIADIKLDLDHPDDNQPSDDAIMLAIADIAQLLDVKAQNTGEGWSVTYQDLTVGPNVNPAVYALQWANFGKPVRIHTIDPSNPLHWSRKIQIIDRQDIENAYDGPVAPPGGEKHNASAVVIYWENGAPMAEFIPVPNQNAQYRFWFETGEIAEPAIGGGIPVQGPFHRYVRIRAALQLLGKCYWSRLLGPMAAAMDPERIMKVMSAHAERLRGDLMPTEAEFRRAYEDYIATAHQSGSGYGNPYGGWADDCY